MLDTFWQFNIIDLLTFMGVGGGILFGILRWLYRRYVITSRVYDVLFLHNPQEFPPDFATSQHYQKSITITTEVAEIFMCIRIKQGVEIEKLQVRFVNRHWLCRWRLWQWNATPGRFAFITVLSDADWERRQKNTIPPINSPKPIEEFDGIGGYRLLYAKPVSLLEGDWLWLQITVQAVSYWKGHIEFYGPSLNKRRAYKRRSVTIQLPIRQAPDTKGPQI